LKVLFLEFLQLAAASQQVVFEPAETDELARAVDDIELSGESNDSELGAAVA
jgi:hypothetical protein